MKFIITPYFFYCLSRDLNLLQRETANLHLAPTSLPLLLRADCELVGVLSGDVVLVGQILGGDSHRRPAVLVGERLPHHVLELRVGAQLDAGAQAADGVRRLGHVVAAARQHDLRVAHRDVLASDNGRCQGTGQELRKL